MSIQWTIIASFLYLEIAVVLLLVLPLAGPRRWQSIFKSRFLNSISNQAGLYFYILLAVLVLFLLDAIREMRKYSNPDHLPGQHQIHHPDLEMQVNMRLFRAQRNFYISGFSLFLSLVIRRLVSLISQQATLLAENEAIMAQAKSATSTARNLLSQSGVNAENKSNEAHDKEITELKKKITDLEKDLNKEKQDKDAIKKQAESTNKEYDRLNEEYRKVLQKVEAGSDKKAD